MNPNTKRMLSTIAIIIASVAFGIVLSADLGLIRKSNAQPSTSTSPIQTTSGAITSVSIPSFADLAARVAPAVVSITTTEVVHTTRHSGGIDPFEFFFPSPNDQSPNQSPNPRRSPHRLQPDDGDDEHAQHSGGSGFIISPDGYILTNNHVVDGASQVQVHYGADENGYGGHTVDAKIIGHDPATDLALVKIDAGTSLPTVPLGDSDHIRKGDWAIAIGNPFQFENTLTVGVISAKGRSLGLSTATQSFENFIQTDASINPGNSGGPLLNINGEVVGINTAIRGGGAQGLGFATPINTAKRLLDQLKQGKVTRGYLGMSISDVTDQVKAGFDLATSQGALVQNVSPGKPADQAGVKAGDIIVDVDGHPMRNNREIIDYISYLPVGTNVKLTLIRNGEHKIISAKTAIRPDDTEKDATTEESTETTPTRNKLGLSVQNLTPQIRQNAGLDDSLKGVIVSSVKEVSPAGEVLAEGDIISEVQGHKTTNVDEFRAAIDGAKSGQTLRVYVTSVGRNGQGTSGYRFIRVP